MAINKAHDEFRALDMSSGGDTPAGCPEGIQQKVLSGALGETNPRQPYPHAVLCARRLHPCAVRP